MTLGVVGNTRHLHVSGVVASGTSEALATLAAQDGGQGWGALTAVVSGVPHVWYVRVAGVDVWLYGPATAGHILSGTITWRTA